MDQKTGWVHADEWYTWFPCTDEDALRLYQGKAWHEIFPNQYKEIPTELRDRLALAVEEMRKVVGEINDWLETQE